MPGEREARSSASGKDTGARHKLDGQRSHLTTGSATRREEPTAARVLTKLTSLLKDTRLLAKKTVRNVILYTVAIACLYPLLVFKNVILIILYLYLWTNIAIAVAGFLDEFFDLPRKR